MVATRDICSGDLIAAEKPLIKVELTPEGDLLGKFDQNKQEVVSPPLLKALNELPDNDLIKFYSLSGKNTNIRTYLCTLNDCNIFEMFFGYLYPLRKACAGAILKVFYKTFEKCLKNYILLSMIVHNVVLSRPHIIKSC